MSAALEAVHKELALAGPGSGAAAALRSPEVWRAAKQALDKAQGLLMPKVCSNGTPPWRAAHVSLIMMMPVPVDCGLIDVSPALGRLSPSRRRLGC